MISNFGNLLLFASIVLSLSIIYLSNKNLKLNGNQITKIIFQLSLIQSTIVVICFFTLIAAFIVSDFAQTIKMVVDDLINEGLTEEEIYSFMSDKYGEWIVFKPQLNIQNSLLWILPYMALILGGFFIIKLFNKKNKIAK